MARSEEKTCRYCEFCDHGMAMGSSPGDDSDGACKGASQWRGTRKECRAKGSKIGGTASCSTAGNVKNCTAPKAPHVPQTAGFSRAAVAACMSH